MATKFAIVFLALSLLSPSCGIFEPDNQIPKDGTWEGSVKTGVIKFVVDGNGTKITYFRITPRIGGTISYGSVPVATIKNNSFEVKSPSGHTGTVTGEFKSSSNAEGKYDLREVDYPNLLQRGSWSAKWKSSSKSGNLDG